MAALVAEVRVALGDALPPVASALCTYLPSPAARAVLAKPIKSNVAEAHGQLAALLESEYAAEEVAAVELTPPGQLAALLAVLG